MSGLPTTRAEALAAGLKHYFTGKPCSRGHVTRRSVANFNCMECSRILVLEAGRADPVRKRATYKRWYDRNAEAMRERSRERAASLRDDPAYKAGNIVRAKRWRAENPEAFKSNIRNRKARLKGATGRVTGADVTAIIKAQRGLCAWCRTKLTEKRHVDHVVPLCRGGEHHRRNLQVLCVPCNLRKHATDPIVFARREGRLL